MTGEIPIPIPDDVLAEFERQDRIKRLLVSDDDARGDGPGVEAPQLVP